MSNTALWDRVCKTDPRQVKEITGKQYKGNSPKPYHIVRHLTEEFGPCGIGWGFTILSERMERLTDHEVLHVAIVRMWYVLGEKRGEVEQIGQTKACYAKKDGGLMTDEDAPKKSVTDALVKCASYLGFAGDIFAGRWDDSKYLAELRREFADKPAQTDQGGAQPVPAKVYADRIRVGVSSGDAVGAAEALASQPQAFLDEVWALLPKPTQDKLSAAWPKDEAA